MRRARIARGDLFTNDEISFRFNPDLNRSAHINASSSVQEVVRHLRSGCILGIFRQDRRFFAGTLTGV